MLLTACGGSSMGTTTAGRRIGLWVVVFGKHSGKPGAVSVFKLPVKANSTPLYTFVLSGTSDPDHLIFDASGNLWVNSHGNGSVLKYTRPFKKSGTLVPATTLTDGSLPHLKTAERDERSVGSNPHPPSRKSVASPMLQRKQWFTWAEPRSREPRTLRSYGRSRRALSVS